MYKNLREMISLPVGYKPKVFIGPRYIRGSFVPFRSWRCPSHLFSRLRNKTNFHAMKFKKFRIFVLDTMLEIRRFTRYPRRWVISYVVKRLLMNSRIHLEAVTAFYRYSLAMKEKRERERLKPPLHRYGVPIISEKLRTVADAHPILKFLFSQPLRIDEGIEAMGICNVVPPTKVNLRQEKRERFEKMDCNNCERMASFNKILADFESAKLLLAGDIEKNPGPRGKGRFFSKFPRIKFGKVYEFDSPTAFFSASDWNEDEVFPQKLYWINDSSLQCINTIEVDCFERNYLLFNLSKIACDPIIEKITKYQVMKIVVSIKFKSDMTQLLNEMRAVGQKFSKFNFSVLEKRGPNEKDWRLVHQVVDLGEDTQFKTSYVFRIYFAQADFLFDSSDSAGVSPESQLVLRILTDCDREIKFDLTVNRVIEISPTGELFY